MKIVYFLIVFTTIESHPATSGLLLREKHKRMITFLLFLIVTIPFLLLKFQVQVSHLLKFIGYLVFVGYLAAKDSSDSSFNKHSRGVA